MHRLDGRASPLVSPPSGPEQLFDDLIEATSARTRLIAFSHVTNLGGCRYPAAEICAWARERDILVLIDGAQSAGALDLDLHAIGCDFFTANSHKWYCGPREAGVLYVRSGVEERLWPTVVGNGSSRATGAARYETLGQRDDGPSGSMVPPPTPPDAGRARSASARRSGPTGGASRSSS